MFKESSQKLFHFQLFRNPLNNEKYWLQWFKNAFEYYIFYSFQIIS
jgi:hypothetical protein